MDELFNKYMPGKATEEAPASTPINDPLFAKYGAPSTASTPTGVPENERVIAPPMSGFTPEQSNELNKRVPTPDPSVASRVGSAVMALPVEFGSNTAKSFTGGMDLYKQGIEDIVSNKPLGVGKAALGLAGAGLSPVTGAIKTFVEEPVTKLTGSKETGEKAGFIVGSGLPVGKATKMTIEAMPSTKSINAIIDTIGGPNKIKAVVDELRSNDRLTLMDVVPATKRMAQKLITTEGQHTNKFEKFVQERIGSGKSATTDIYDAGMGVPVNIVDKVKSLKEAASNVGKKEINPAVSGAGPVNITDVIKNIDDKLAPTVRTDIPTSGNVLPLGDIEKPLTVVRKFLTDDTQVRTSATQLHQFQSALRAKAEDLLNSTVSAERQQGYALMNVRNDIVEAIDKAAGGTYKPALAKFRDEKQVENAFNMGQLVTRNKLGRLEDTPEFWDNWVKAASKEELEAAREGARLAIQHQISGFKAGARKGQDILESEFNKEKLASLFGKDEIDRMAKLLKDERNIAITNSELIGNSQTAMRMKADSRVDLPVQKPAGLGPFLAPIAEIAAVSTIGPSSAGLSTAALGGKALYSWGKHKTDMSLAKARNERISDLLTATGDEREALIKILESKIPQPKQSLLQRTRNLALPVLPP